jgi:hypothetical protein
MTETERVRRTLRDYERMIANYIQNTPDPATQKAGIKAINRGLIVNFRDAGFSPAELASLMRFSSDEGRLSGT